MVAMFFVLLPFVLLSGFVFAIPLMPTFLQVASYLVPARYLVTIAKGVYLKGVGLEVLWPSALMLVFFAVLFLVILLCPVNQCFFAETSVQLDSSIARLNASILLLRPTVSRDKGSPRHARHWSNPRQHRIAAGESARPRGLSRSSCVVPTNRG